MTANGPIFIVGCPRSGTTLLQRLLSFHPRISFPAGESNFLIPFYETIDKYGDLSRQENVERLLADIWALRPEYYKKAFFRVSFDAAELSRKFHKLGCDTFPKIVSALYHENAKPSTNGRWGDKTPYHTLHIGKIMKMFPEAQIINMVRDGRDVAISMIERENTFRIYNIYQAAEIWRTYLEAGILSGERLSGSSYLDVRYEDLVLHPRDTMMKICAFLQEAYDEKLINFKPYSDGGDVECGSPLLLQPTIQSSNINKWKGCLSAYEEHLFERTAGSLLKRYGYETLYEAGRVHPVEKVWFRAHQKLCSVLFSGRRGNI